MVVQSLIVFTNEATDMTLKVHICISYCCSFWYWSGRFRNSRFFSSSLPFQELFFPLSVAPPSRCSWFLSSRRSVGSSPSILGSPRGSTRSGFPGFPNLHWHLSCYYSVCSWNGHLGFCSKDPVSFKHSGKLVILRNITMDIFFEFFVWIHVSCLLHVTTIQLLVYIIKLGC